METMHLPQLCSTHVLRRCSCCRDAVVASTGELIIADNYDHRIRLVNNSIITTIAGSSVSIDYGNGGFHRGHRPRHGGSHQ